MEDVIIIGAGPAGLTAALYTARRKLKTLVISKDLGGQAALTDAIYNYPGISQTGGMPLMQSFKEQAMAAGAGFVFQEVSKVVAMADGFEVQAGGKSYAAKAVILAFGLTPRDMGLPGEEKFKGDSIFCAATEHGPHYAGKDIAIIGGGNSAFDSALFLQPLARKLYLIHRREGFRGEEITLQKMRTFQNLEFVLNSDVVSLVGDKKLTGVKVKNNQTNEERTIAVDAICVNIGYGASTKWVGDLVERDARGHIVATMDTTTKTPGLFAAGDCTSSPYKQIVTSGGEGCKAAIKAYEYLMAKQGKRAILIDWT